MAAGLDTVAAGLEEGEITPETPMILPGSVNRGNRKLNDSHPHPDEYRTVAGALAQSSNTGTMLIGETMSPKTLEEYLRRFGLGSTSGSALSVAGTCSPKKSMVTFVPTPAVGGSQA